MGRGLGDEGRLCKTKPIWRWPASIRGRIVQNEPNFRERTGRGRGPFVQNEANSRRRRVGRGPGGRQLNCAKRTQFRSADRPWPGADCAKQTQFPPRAGRTVTQANRAKQSQLSLDVRKWARPDRAPESSCWESMMRNKPNSGTGRVMVSALRENGYDEFHPQERAKKQSQFRKQFQV